MLEHEGFLDGKVLDAADFLFHDAKPENHVAQQAAGVRIIEIDIVNVFVHFAHVVQQRSDDEDLRVELLVVLRNACHQSSHRDRMLEKPSQVGMVYGFGCGRARETIHQACIAKDASKEQLKGPSFDCSHQPFELLQKDLLLDGTDGQKVRRINLLQLHGADGLDLNLQLIPVLFGSP